jgi:NTP pyrophosphatase (non-canonical NTP hydrolase)
MILENELQPIRDWAEEKGIFEKGDPKTQYIKLQEEAGELAKAILNNDKEEVIDALGDCTIVLVNLAELCGYSLEDCVNSAYSVISKRTGKMSNGTFVKD